MNAINYVPTTVSMRAMQQPRYLRLFMVGLPGAGKTCVMAACIQPNMKSRLENSTMRPVDESTATRQYVQEHAAAIRSGSFPEPTVVETELLFVVDKGGQATGVSTKDLRGALWSDLSQNDDELQQLIAQLCDQADGLLILVDVLHTNRQMADALQRNLEALFARWPDSMKANGRIGLPVALVVTKGDRYFDEPRGLKIVRAPLLAANEPVQVLDPRQDWSEFQLRALDRPLENDSQGVRSFLLEHTGPAGANLVKSLEMYCAVVGYHMVSALGMSQSGKEWVGNARYSKGSVDGEIHAVVRSPMEWAPINIHAPFLQLAFGLPVPPKPRPGWAVTVTSTLVLLATVVGYLTWEILHAP